MIYAVPEWDVDEPWGRFHATIRVSGHEADWGMHFMDATMGGAGGEAGWAAWTAERLLVVGSFPDIEDSGYLCFALSEPVPRPESVGFNAWRLALARAITTRGSMPADKSTFGFRPIE